MNHRSDDLINAIDEQKYELIEKILSSSNGKLINNGYSDENTLIRSIKSTFSKDIDQFNPEIIELLFNNGARCITLPSHCNTLNTVIILSNKYIDSFDDDNKKLMAEQNAIKVIDIVIKHGARGIDCIEEANTLSIAMNCANINILKFLINLDSGLDLKPYNHIGNVLTNPMVYQTLDCALSASHKTGNADFFRIALSNGAVPQYCCNDLIVNIFALKLVSIVDCIVFGGDNFSRYFSSHFNTIVSYHRCGEITDENMMEILEIIMCTSSDVSSPSVYHFSDGPVREFVRGYHNLLTGEYSKYDKNSFQYKNAIDIKNRLASRIQWLICIAKDREKHNERKSIIENKIIILPIVCTNIIVEYDEYMPRFKTIDLSKC